jgi:hypothetical protein
MVEDIMSPAGESENAKKTALNTAVLTKALP